jgi:hypothetical protein
MAAPSVRDVKITSPRRWKANAVPALQPANICKTELKNSTRLNNVLIVNKNKLYNKLLFSLVTFYAEALKAVLAWKSGPPNRRGLLSCRPPVNMEAEACGEFGGKYWHPCRADAGCGA